MTKDILKPGIIEIVRLMVAKKCINCKVDIEVRFRIPLCASCRLDYLNEEFEEE